MHSSVRKSPHFHRKDTKFCSRPTRKRYCMAWRANASAPHWPMLCGAVWMRAPSDCANSTPPQAWFMEIDVSPAKADSPPRLTRPQETFSGFEFTQNELFRFVFQL